MLYKWIIPTLKVSQAWSGNVCVKTVNTLLEIVDERGEMRCRQILCWKKIETAITSLVITVLAPSLLSFTQQMLYISFNIICDVQARWSVKFHFITSTLVLSCVSKLTHYHVKLQNKYLKLLLSTHKLTNAHTRCTNWTCIWAAPALSITQAPKVCKCNNVD